MKQQIEKLQQEAKVQIENAQDTKVLQNLKVEFLGKQSPIVALLKDMKNLSVEDKKVFGPIINQTRQQLEEIFEVKKEQLEEEALQEQLKKEKIDITAPSKVVAKGEFHPLSKIFDKLADCLETMGFQIVTGPEIESDYYNFEALNVPKDHPARDMQDSFYITENILLRTQTSSVQIRSMENLTPPIKIASPGRTYRAEKDSTHSPVFHQFEGLVIDKNVSMVDLKAMLTKLLQMLFGEETKIRFRPSYFPFTEPSVEVDASCPNCGGKGCRICKQTGFLELLGAGMVNPKVLKNCGIDTDVYSGFAFGMGADRLSMVINKIPELKMMFDNDTKFLKQLR